MHTYAILIRGINVGGKNTIPMAELKLCLEELGCERVVTYIRSGNAVLRSNIDTTTLRVYIEDILPRKFKLNGTGIKAAAFDYETFKKIVLQAPEDFGEDPGSYRYNVLFLIDSDPSRAMEQIERRPGIDEVRQGDHAIYFRNSIPARLP